jgi:hypothetical protein
MNSFIKAEPISLRDEFGAESFVQDLLAKDPSLLTLGDLVLRGKERVQSSSGRLDLLYESPDGTTWYEVEVQLGGTNETHIIRTLEYWDNERRHRPNINHIAVIVAEHITQRYFNVIALFNQHIPVIAIQMSAINVGGNKTIHFTKVLDHSVQSTPIEEDVYEPSDRSYWVKRTSEGMIQIVDKLLKFAKEKDPTVEYKYTKGYINTYVDGQRSNFISLKPQKKSVRMSLFSPQSPSLEAKIKSEGFEFEFEEKWNKYRIWADEREFSDHEDFFRDLVHLAYDAAETEQPLASD